MPPKNGVNLNCKVCNTEYYVPKYRELKSKFCSVKCQNNGQYESIKKTCPQCKKDFFVSNSRISQKYCSDMCSNYTKLSIVEQRQKAKRHSRVKRGNITGSTLRRFVFDNKPKKCEICGYDEHDFCLDIHHVDKNPQNNIIENLAVLCALCHRKLHKKVISYHDKRQK